MRSVRGICICAVMSDSRSGKLAVIVPVKTAPTVEKLGTYKYFVMPQKSPNKPIYK